MLTFASGEKATVRQVLKNVGYLPIIYSNLALSVYSKFWKWRGLLEEIEIINFLL